MEMTKNALAIILSGLELFTDPDVSLEQYATPGDIAAELLMAGQEFITGKDVLDLGCGTGVLSIGAEILGARHVLCVDSDPEALQICRRNHQSLAQRLELDEMDIRRQDITSAAFGPHDTVVMNPPFGTKRRSADKQFLQTAMCADAILSMHKTATMPHIRSWMGKHGYTTLWQKDVRFPIKASMKHHRKPKKDAAVSLCIFKKSI